MKQIYRLILISYFILQASSAFSAQTDCPVQLALTYTNGDTVTTQVNYEVHFYSALTGGTEIATAETDSLIPSGGVLVIPITCDTTLLSHPNIFLEFIINGETLTPRVEMASTPFAGTAFAVAGNSINLGTDTVGSYVQSLTAGTGISITGGSGEGATPTISATGLTLSAGDVTSTIILDGTIAAVDLADGSVTSAKIVDGTITNTDIVAAAGIPYSKLTFTDNIVAGDIATSAVTTTEILDATITSTDVAADAFDFTSLVDSMTLDASTDISVTGTNVFSITNTGTGNSFVVNDDVAVDATPFVIDNAGNVGIQKTVPTAALDVSGNIVVSGTITSGCPAGYYDAGDYCISSLNSNDAGAITGSWHSAAHSCRFNSSAHLCSPAEVLGVCLTGGAITLSGREWTSQLDSTTQGIVINNGLAGCAVGSFESQGLGNLYGFRCCYDK